MELYPRTNSKGNWFWSNNEIFELSFKTKKPYLLAVYFYLCKCADNFTHICWPNEKTIATQTGMSLRQVKKAIKELHQRGLIGIKRKGRDLKTKNIYLLTSKRMWVRAPRAPTKVHSVHPNKTQLNNKNTLLKIKEMQGQLIARYTIKS